MSVPELVAIFAIVLALAFDFVNGFHDTANAVATVIYTKALKPRTAIILSGLFNFAGAVLVGTAVAKVITHIIPQESLSLLIVLAVLLAGLVWNLLTWYFGIPVSSSHCLIGSLFGAGIAAGGMSGVSWGEFNKVSMALLLSPIAGFAGGALLSWFAAVLVKKNACDRQMPLLRFAQILSSACVSFSHGGNDGQKTMGIITLILAIAFPAAGYSLSHVPFWVMVAAALAMGLGTTIGGGRVIRTIGEKLTQGEWHYTHGFGAEVSTAMIISLASAFGAPISTTHTLTSAVAGGAVSSYGAKQLNRSILQVILLAWVVTLPAVALISAGTYTGLRYLFPRTLNITVKTAPAKPAAPTEPFKFMPPARAAF
ncbi:MAG: inorganic phosphate transporter [Candidatus Obscuribacterales bacterium]|nr:inorganic phosphate transporter [Candidatus Obscuribacterales bacterium]